MRKVLLEKCEWNFIARLGENGFESSQAAGAFTSLNILSIKCATSGHTMGSIDSSAAKNPSGKNDLLLNLTPVMIDQKAQLSHPDSRIILDENYKKGATASEVSESYQGAVTGDISRFIMSNWEVPSAGNIWEPFRTAISANEYDDGLTCVIRWENGDGELSEYAKLSRAQLHDMHESGQKAWGRLGVAINRIRGLYATVYTGTKFDNNVAVLVPKTDDLLLPLLCFCTSNEFPLAVRSLDQTLKVTNQTLRKVTFNQNTWEKVAAEKYPDGFPKPFSSDPTQWIFNGHPKDSDNPLQVAVARLLCYNWPRQTGSSFPGCSSIGSDGLEKHIDDDGIVCLNPLKGEPPAAERLNSLLADAYGHEWSASKQASLLSEGGYAGRSLDDWLRDGFFAQHCELFQNRPFIWHIWDGRRDGFHALVNYHLLSAPDGEGRRTLDKLIYTYLGDWIDGQRRDQAAEVEGADARLVSAEHLKAELEKIRNGEPPYDIFVRWKPLHKQAIGWEPDINDGVRLNIRPFMTAKPYGAKTANACILRTTPKNIKWEKDRGKEPERKKEEYPWFWSWDGKTEDFAGSKEFDGNRCNDLHYSNECKRAARERQGS